MTHHVDAHKAACRAEQEALQQFRGVHEVTATADDGSIVVTVTLDPSADEAALRIVLDRYAIRWEIKERP
jgi:multidrug efflux pump subunit AcrB